MKYIYIPVASFLSHHYPKAISIAGKVFFFCLICVIIVVLVIRCKESFRKRQGLFWLLYLMVASCIRRIKQWLERIKQWLGSLKQQEEERLVIRAIYNSLSPKEKEERLAIRAIYNSLSPNEKVNLEQEFIRTVLKNDPSLYKKFKNGDGIRELFFYDEFLQNKLGE